MNFELGELIAGGIPCHWHVMTDPDEPPRGCQNLATWKLFETVYCDACSSAGQNIPRPKTEANCGSCSFPVRACECAKRGTAPKYDAGKRRWHLLPWETLGSIVDVLTWACTRESPPPYPEESWRDVSDPTTRYLDAFDRHFVAWRVHWKGQPGGSLNDADSGLHHLAHAACNLLFLLHFEVVKKGEKQ